MQSLYPPTPPPQHDLRNSVGIPLSPSFPNSDFSPSVPRQPPPYRPPPPPTPSPNISFDNISLSSTTSETSITPQAPPRRRSADKKAEALTVMNKTECFNGKLNGVEQQEDANDKQTVSVKERTQKFNRMASVEDELNLSPKQQKEKEKKKVGGK